jgi:glycosyltransferase involved in cell wall biosynthesis
MPNALLEAMACGLACIAARLPGITDILFDNGSCGILFQPDNREELIEALEKLSADQALREKMGLKAQQKASTAYDIRDAAQSYREFVLGISGRNKENR